MFPTWTEIDLDALRANLAAIRRIIDGRRILLVVKADAYGHGAPVVASEALGAGVDMLGVATVHEGVELRRAGIMAPILILSPCLTGEAEEIVRWGLRCTVSHREFLDVLAGECQRAGTTLPIHVEVDTGMGRSGVAPHEVGELVRAVQATSAVLVEGLYTHFPDADAADLVAARAQIETFGALVAELRAAGCLPEVVHAANSAALLNLPDSHLDMVRPGLLAYGVRVNGGTGDGVPVELPEFRPVMSFRSRLVQVRELPGGSTISYGRTYVTQGPTRIGVVAAGYGHGLALEMSGRGQLLVRGRQVPIRGRVTMDMTMVDLTGVPEARVEDEVVIFGESEGAAIRIDEVASWCNTIPYEIMCSIGKRVPRVYRRGGETVRITTLIGERRRRSTDDVPRAPIPAPALGRIGVAPIGGHERLG